MLSLAALVELIAGEVWAIRPSALRAVLGALELKRDDSPLPHFAAAATRRAGARDRWPISSGTAIMPLRGILTRRPSLLSDVFGGTTLEEFGDKLAGNLSDRDVDRIVLDVDSPGGAVDGVPEMAAEIYAARAKKPVTAFIDTTGASAAYWLASQASEVIVTPSGSVGSIGIYGLHLDHSRELDQAGITPTFIQAGTYKTEENPLQPLTDEAKSAIQERVNDFYGMFVRDVARGRSVSVEQVHRDFGGGRMVLALDAAARGMADAVAMTPGSGATSSARRVGAAAVRAHGSAPPDADLATLVAAAKASALRGLLDDGAPRSRAVLLEHEVSLSGLPPARRRVLETAERIAASEHRPSEYHLRLFRAFAGQTFHGTTYPNLHLPEIWICGEGKLGEIVNTLGHEMSHLWSPSEDRARAYALDLQRRLWGSIAHAEREETA